MKYIVCETPHHFSAQEKKAPVKEAGKALLAIRRVGICGTDLHAYNGKQPFFTYPRILGHELAAEVLEIEENEQGLKAGDKVVIMPYVNCGTCVACRQGKTNCCTSLQVLGVHTDGGMQEIISVPNELLLPANHLSFESIAVVEPLAIAAHAIRRTAIQEGEYVAVVGCGPIGIGILAFAKLKGAKTIAIDVNPDRLKYAKEVVGVDYTVSALDNPVEAVSALTNGDLAHAVIDATGNQKALEAGPLYMGHGGRYVLVGIHNGPITFHHPSIHAKETSLLCSRNATTEDFKWVMEVLAKGDFPLDSFITHTVAFDEMLDHFESWLKPETGVIKAMVTL